MNLVAPAEAPLAATSLSGRRRLVALGNFFFRWRNGMFPLVFVPLWLLSRPRPAFGSSLADAALDLAGFAVALSGQLLRAGAIGYVYIVRGGKNRRLHAEDLVQEGMFALTRNPLYAGNFLIVLGLFTMIFSPLGYGVGVPFFALAYLAIVAAEEAYLLHKFGGVYADYCRRVPRFFPSLGALRKALAGHRFDWRRLARKEYGTTFTWVALALGIVARERLAAGGWKGARPGLEWVLAGFAALAGAYGTLRFLKKTQRL